LRGHVSFANEDRIFAVDVEKAAGLLRSFDFVNSVSQFAKEQGLALNKGYEQFEL
jgi:histidine ammonia-lyase